MYKEDPVQCDARGDQVAFHGASGSFGDCGMWASLVLWDSSGASPYHF